MKPNPFTIKEVVTKRSKSPRAKSKKKRPLKNLKEIQKMFPELTNEIYQAIHEEKIRERKLLERERKFKETQKQRSRRNSI